MSEWIVFVHTWVHLDGAPVFQIRLIKERTELKRREARGGPLRCLGGLPLLVAPPRTLPYGCGSRLWTRCVLCSRRSGRCPQPSGLLVARGRRGQTGGVEAAGPEGSASPSTRLAGVPPLCKLGVLSGAGRRAAPRAAGSLSPGRVSGGMLSARGGLAAGPLMSVTHSEAP